MQVATLTSMSSLKIASYRIKRISGAEVFVGGFGDVEQAQLRESPFGASPVMALKRLRPTGDRAQRIRVIAVSMSLREITRALTPIS